AAVVLRSEQLEAVRIQQAVQPVARVARVGFAGWLRLGLRCRRHGRGSRWWFRFGTTVDSGHGPSFRMVGPNPASGRTEGDDEVVPAKAEGVVERGERSVRQRARLAR